MILFSGTGFLAVFHNLSLKFPIMDFNPATLIGYFG